MSILLSVTGLYRNNKSTAIGCYQPKNYNFINASPREVFLERLDQFTDIVHKFKKVTVKVTVNGSTEILAIYEANKMSSAYTYVKLDILIKDILRDYKRLEREHMIRTVLIAKDDPKSVTRTYIDSRYRSTVIRHLKRYDVEVIQLNDIDAMSEKNTFQIFTNTNRQLVVMSNNL